MTAAPQRRVRVHMGRRWGRRNVTPCIDFHGLTGLNGGGERQYSSVIRRHVGPASREDRKPAWEITSLESRSAYCV